MDLCRGSALGAGEDYVDEVFSSWDYGDLLEIVLNHFQTREDCLIERGARV